MMQYTIFVSGLKWPWFYLKNGDLTKFDLDSTFVLVNHGTNKEDLCGPQTEHWNEHCISTTVLHM